jgi:broad specificity polyphosphatase/5'/3'-nucleotidase SurE|tara:strand:+ start:744 stop:1679 length:936 start_codon:yes stop_codon:yes gene_type:complete
MSHTILITNDDGIDAPGITALVQGLYDAGYRIVVCAPDRERSASTMHLTLHRVMKLRRRNDLLKIYRLKDDGPEIDLFDISGYPADSVLTALSGGLPSNIPTPSLCISGINRGPNMSVDILHSGTIGGARQAGTCGIPAIATSLDTFEPNDYSTALRATLELVKHICAIIPEIPVNLGREGGSLTKPEGENDKQILRNALILGDIYINLNVPVEWQGEFSTTHLGSRWYRGAIEIVGDDSIERDDWDIQLGAASIEDEPIINGDSYCVSLGLASVSSLGTWPQGHPLAISDELLATTSSGEGLPSWLVIDQ